MLKRQRRQAAEAALESNVVQLAEARARLASDGVGALDALELAVDGLWEEYLECLRGECDRSWFTRVPGWADRQLRTDEPEYMDSPDLPEATRREALAMLHQWNLRLGTYRNALSYLTPSLREARHNVGRTPRLMDLASGYGGFPLMLGKLARERGLDVRVSGSDVQPAHVAHAQECAWRESLEVGFEVVNAFHMTQLEEGQYDLVTILQAMHHFSPGQLARMISEATRVTTTGFVGIDPERSLVLPFLMGAASYAMTRSSGFTHDAFLSGRKMYHNAELTMIARAVAPEATIRCRTAMRGFNVLEVLRAA